MMFGDDLGIPAKREIALALFISLICWIIFIERNHKCRHPISIRTNVFYCFSL